MKFCYLDESGTGQDTLVIITGIVVDVKRMNRTKREWDKLRPRIDRDLGRPIAEIKGSKLIPKSKRWQSESGQRKLKIVDLLLDWLVDRKHGITFAAVDKTRFQNLEVDNVRKADCKNVWNAAAFHILLSLQSCHQKDNYNKGNTVFIFDAGIESPRLIELVNDPPAWSDDYYDRKPKKERLNQIVDVPFYADSKLLPMIQLADLICAILRRYADLKDYGAGESTEGELSHYETWVKKIQKLCIARSHRYRSQKPGETAKFFRDLAPASLRKI